MGKQSTRATYSLSRRSRARFIDRKVSKILKPSSVRKVASATERGDRDCTQDKVNSRILQFNSPADESSDSFDLTEAHCEFDNILPGVPVECELSNVNRENSNRTILESLRDWSIDNNISRTAFSELLRKLKGHSCFQNFPVDPRTVLNTPTTTPTTAVGNGNSIYIGILHGLKVLLPRIKESDDKVIYLNFNIDGLPLFRSSSVQFWPILASVFSINYVFPVAVYCGENKPNDLDIYFNDFITELTNLEKEGLVYDGVHYLVKVKAFICDAPARSFVCAIKNHTGYYGCGKCEVKGKYVQNRVVFTKTTAALRTNESFRTQNQSKHHNGHTPLLGLNIDLVKCFPYDYMHLVCLGVVKKLLKLWIEGKRMPYRLRVNAVHNISSKLEDSKTSITADFVRKPRTLKEIDRCKATEFRTFLLYTGPVVLNTIIEDKYYKNFMVLSVAIRLLAEPNQSEQNVDYAESLLIYFVEDFKILYGRENLSYNVHGLIHLANDVREHGALDEFGAFRYENYLGRLKRILRSHRQPLQQIHRRLKEWELLSPFLNNSNFESVKGNSIRLKFPDNIVFLKDQSLIQITDNYDIARSRLSESTFTSDLSDAAKPSKKKGKTAGPVLPQHPEAPFTFDELSGIFPDDALENNICDVNVQPNTSSSLVDTSEVNNTSSVSQLENVVAQALVIDDTAFKTAVLTKLEDIKMNLDQQQSTLYCILQHISSGAGSTSSASSYVIPANLIPCKEIGELSALNEMITSDSNLREKLKGMLSTAGGHSVEESVGRMLCLLMTDQLMASCNLKGKGKTGKNGISIYSAVLSLLYDGLMINPRTNPSTTIPGLNDGIAKALKRADDRLRQRNLRNAIQNESQ